MTKLHAETAELASQKCTIFAKGTPALTGTGVSQFKLQLRGNWKVKGKKQLEKAFKFPDFLKALHFTNQVGKLAQKENHHPDIYLSYGEVRLQLSTHSVGGLSPNDFILAAKINQL